MSGQGTAPCYPDVRAALEPVLFPRDNSGLFAQRAPLWMRQRHSVSAASAQTYHVEVVTVLARA